MLNIGILYRSIEILALLDELNITQDRFLRNFPYYKYIKTQYIFDVSITCGWTQNTEDEYLKPTKRGYELLSKSDNVSTLRLQIKDILRVKPPNWLSILKRGRREAKRYMSKNEIQCFKNADLLDKFDYSIATWWDDFFISSFEHEEKEHFVTGRKGEYLTLILERLRTKQTPKFISFDVNFAGYDVLSQISISDSTPLYIEVKCSKSNWNQAKFYLTRNEWDIFTRNKNSTVYLWSLSPVLSLSRIKYELLQKSIPQDHGSGKWRNVEIPFRICDPTKNPFARFANVDQKTKKWISNILDGKDLSLQLVSEAIS